MSDLTTTPTLLFFFIFLQSFLFNFCHLNYTGPSVGESIRMYLDLPSFTSKIVRMLTFGQNMISETWD